MTKFKSGDKVVLLLLELTDHIWILTENGYYHCPHCGAVFPMQFEEKQHFDGCPALTIIDKLNSMEFDTYE